MVKVSLEVESLAALEAVLRGADAFACDYGTNVDIKRVADLLAQVEKLKADPDNSDNWSASLMDEHNYKLIANQANLEEDMCKDLLSFNCYLVFAPGSEWHTSLMTESHLKIHFETTLAPHTIGVYYIRPKG